MNLIVTKAQENIQRALRCELEEKDMTQATAIGELIKSLRKLESVGAPMTFGQLVADELTGQPLADRILRETWRAFVAVQVSQGTLKADLPVSDTSLVHGLTDHGRKVIAAFEEIGDTAGR